MNEVKELVDELRNKKSRDNRELLDRSADMIERFAKFLCEKSGCHHKCHDTKDCVVEDEAKEVISILETTTEKQIEEMAQFMAEISHLECGKKPCEECKWLGRGNDEADCTDYLIAEALYNAGYRKQRENTVDIVRCKDCVWWEAREYGSTIGRCQNPHNGLISEYSDDNDFCSYGKMKGGE